MKKWSALLLGISLAFFAMVLVSPVVEARDPTVDVVTFNPATDDGRYVTIHQSETLPQWHFNFGGYFTYGHEPLELRNSVTGARVGVVDDLFQSNFHGAVGFVDWFQAGLDIPVFMYESYYDPNSLAVRNKESVAGLGDMRLETKFRLLDLERFPVGIAVVPFMTFPTGKTGKFLSNEQFSGGAKAVIEGNIADRVWLSMNWGWQYLKNSRYWANNPDAYVHDMLLFGLGIHGKINDQWKLLAEVYGETVRDNAFASARQTPVEAIGGVRFEPKARSVRGLAITAGGGGGLTKGIGTPNFRAFVGIDYRKPKVVDLEGPKASDVEVQEKIIITQKIHFEFNKATIRPISFPILDDVVAVIAKNPQIRRLQVEGHTDWIGGDAYNQRLSESRAQSVVNYLVSKGISRDRLTAVGYGKSKPIADNRTTEGRAMNRRVEFTVTD